MQIREGWRVGIGSVCGAAAAFVGLLIAINVAPVDSTTVGIGLVLAGIAAVVP